ncbi:MAG TPA: ferrous iron transport protein A [Tissierellaceae bacterium]|nr:ferrous iron transport protein A [Tissierellaceae bacterium]
MDRSPLTSLEPNEVGIIMEICGGCRARRRLYELGLNKGTKVRMVKNDIGPVILNLYGHKLALGKGLANKILVEK